MVFQSKFWHGDTSKFLNLGASNMLNYKIDGSLTPEIFSSEVVSKFFFSFYLSAKKHSFSLIFERDH